MTDHYIETGVWHRLVEDLAYPQAPDQNDPEMTRREEIAKALAHAGIWPDAIAEDRADRMASGAPAGVAALIDAAAWPAGIKSDNVPLESD